jgi:hypothetical protein
MLLVQIGVAAVTVQCKSWSALMSDLRNMQAAQAALRAAEQSGKLGNLEIVYFVGGGAPPPHNSMRQLSIYLREGTDTLEFERVRHDPRFSPSELLEKWRGAATPDDVRAVAKSLLATSALTQAFAEEASTTTKDRRRVELVLSLGKETVATKTFHVQAPARLSSLVAVFDQLIEHLKSQGQRTLYHGTEIVSDPPGGLGDGLR